jgi:hypothetical protein
MRSLLTSKDVLRARLSPLPLKTKETLTSLDNPFSDDNDNAVVHLVGKVIPPPRLDFKPPTALTARVAMRYAVEANGTSARPSTCCVLRSRLLHELRPTIPLARCVRKNLALTYPDVFVALFLPVQDEWSRYLSWVYASMESCGLRTPSRERGEVQ